MQNFCTFQIYTVILDHVKRALVTYPQKWHILKSHTCRPFWWTFQPFSCKPGLVGGFWNFREIEIFSNIFFSFVYVWKSPANLSDQMWLDPKKICHGKKIIKLIFHFFSLKQQFFYKLRLYIWIFIETILLQMILPT